MGSPKILPKTFNFRESDFSQIPVKTQPRTQNIQYTNTIEYPTHNTNSIPYPTHNTNTITYPTHHKNTITYPTHHTNTITYPTHHTNPITYPTHHTNTITYPTHHTTYQDVQDTNKAVDLDAGHGVPAVN